MSGKAIAPQALKDIANAIDSGKNELTKRRDLAIFQLLTYGGLRRSEVAGVEWDNLTREGEHFVLRLPDTKSGMDQDIKLQEVVVQQLQEYHHALVKNGHRVDGRAFISLSRNASHGKPLTDQSVNLIMKKYARKAGIPTKITAHMFRHTCCTLAIEGGAKPQQVQAHLRHKDLKTTRRYYENREKLADNASDYINI